MPSVIALILTSVVTLFVLVRSRRVYGKPAPRRQRTSKITLFAGILIAVFGFFGLVTMLLTPDLGWTVGPIVSNICMWFGGLFLIYYYSNSFVDVFPDRVVYRGVGRRSKTFEYKDIRKYDVIEYNAQQTLRVWDANGRKYRLNITNFNGGALLKYVQWLDELNSYAQSNFPGASDKQIHQWIWENQQARATEELNQARAAATSIATESLPPSQQQDSDPQPPSSAATPDPRGSFGGGDAFGTGDKGTSPHGPFYNK